MTQDEREMRIEKTVLLNRLEAAVLVAVLWRVGGGPEDSYRRETDSVCRRIERVFDLEDPDGYARRARVDRHLGEGSLFFQDHRPHQQVR